MTNAKTLTAMARYASSAISADGLARIVKIARKNRARKVNRNVLRMVSRIDRQ